MKGHTKRLFWTSASRQHSIIGNPRFAICWLGITFLSIGLNSFFSPSASATSSSINVQLSSSTLSLDIMPRVNGAFAKSSDNTVSITTNNYTGYTLKLQAGTSGTNATKLVSSATGSTIDSIESSITESAFSADTSEAASNYNGKWGYKPSKYVTTSNNTTTIVDNTGDNAVYLPSPDATNGTTLDITSTANPTTPNTYTISLGARAGYETVAGTYSNTFNFLAIGNPIVYSITFSDNTSDSSVSGLPTGTGSVSTADIDVLIPTTVPTRTGYTFLGWCKEATTNNGTTCSSNTPYPASTAQTPSYYEIDQTADNTDLTFYATWTPADYTITLNAGNGIDSLSLSGWTGTGTGTMTKTYQYGDTIDLSTITPTYKTAYSGKAYAKNDSVGTLSDSTYTVGAGSGDITINATSLATPTCSILGGTTKVYNRSATTLTATDNSSNYDTSSTDITYSFGYALGSSTVDGSTANLGNFSAAQASNTYTVAKNAFRSAYGRFYGVTVTATDKNDSSITATCTSGTGYGTTAAANRTRLILVNSRIDFDANGGTLSGTSPIYVIYQSNASYSSRTGSTASAIPTATSSLMFDGWYTASSGGTKVVNADGTLVSSVSGWTDSSGRWIRTSTTSSASTSNTLYAHYVACPSGKICYNPSGSNVKGTMGNQDMESSIDLLASNFSRTGYGFAGWTNKYDYATNTDSDLRFYGPQENVTLNVSNYSGTNNGLILYAVWVESEGSLQDTNKVASVCSSLTAATTYGNANLSSVSALTDQRDNNTYAIAKLADGKCWMIENLRLDNTATHNSDGTLAQGYGTSTIYGNFSGLAEAESTGFSYTATANSLYYSGTQEGTASVDIGTDENNPAYRMPRYNNLNTQSRAQGNPNNNSFEDSDTIGGMYSYGNYYSWHAAIADLTYRTTDNSSATSTSLCPTGWHLPTGGRAYASGSSGNVNITGTPSTYRDYYYLAYVTMQGKTAYEDTPNMEGGSYYSTNTTNLAGRTAMKAFRRFPINTVYSGYYAGSKAYSRGTAAMYWTSTTSQWWSRSYRMSIVDSGSVPYMAPGTNTLDKYDAATIRCIANS